MIKKLLFVVPHVWLLFVGVYAHIAIVLRWQPGDSLIPLFGVAVISTFLIYRYGVARGA